MGTIKLAMKNLKDSANNEPIAIELFTAGHFRLYTKR